jgi:Tfp pilus assembly protein PilF
VRRFVRVLAVVTLLAAAATAQSPAELAQQAKAIGARAAVDDPAAEEKAIAELGQLSVAFIQAADKATLQGGSGSADLRAAFDAIHAPLARIRDRHLEAMESGERTIIEADGDLEAYYDRPAYQQEYRIAANALYYLNWLHYYGAKLQTGEARTRLLNQARDGFAEFSGGDPQSELVAESLLGRGLCSLELGKLRDAVEDLGTVAKSPTASAERRHKARLSLLEAYVRAGNVQAALRQSDELLKDAPPAEANWVRYMRLRALLDAVKKGGPDAAGQRSEALVLMDRLRRAGGAWEQQVAALAQEAFTDPDAWKANATTAFAKWELARLYVQKEDYEGAAPLLEAVLKSDDPGIAQFKPRARYFLGLVRFEAGDYAAAAALLSDESDASDRSDRSDASDKSDSGLEAKEAADAAYLLFKAREQLAAAAGADADLAGLEAAAQTLVDDYPQHPSAFEARYRLGELHQLRGDFAAAIGLYAGVKGDAGFELQAAFATAQARFELYKLAETPEARATVLAQVDADLDEFEKRLGQQKKTAAGDVPLEAMGAKAAVMRAVACKLQPESDYKGLVAALDGFEEKYPDEKELFAQVARLRLEAYRDLAGFAAAKALVERHGDLLLADLGAGALEEAAVAFVREGARRSGEGDKAANEAAQQVALVIYARLAQQDDAGERTRLTLARLRENTGDLDGAAALYAEMLQGEKVSTSALRGLARIAEEKGDLGTALEYWRKLGEAVRPGDVPWFESHYEQARVTDLRGDKAGSCAILEKLRPAMPGLSDQDLRGKLTGLYDRVCS